MLKNHQTKSNHKVQRKNYVDTYGWHVFAPDDSATGLAAKMLTNSQWAFYLIRFLWSRDTMSTVM